MGMLENTNMFYAFEQQNVMIINTTIGLYDHNYNYTINNHVKHN
jgi:hypothetical protein